MRATILATNMEPETGEFVVLIVDVLVDLVSIPPTVNDREHAHDLG